MEQFAEELEEFKQARLAQPGISAIVTLGDGTVHHDEQWKRAQDLQEILMSEREAAVARDERLYRGVKDAVVVVERIWNMSAMPPLLKDSVLAEFESMTHRGLEAAWNATVRDIEEWQLRSEENTPILWRANEIIQERILNKENKIIAGYFRNGQEGTVEGALANDKVLQALRREQRAIRAIAPGPPLQQIMSPAVMDAMVAFRKRQREIDEVSTRDKLRLMVREWLSGGPKPEVVKTEPEVIYAERHP